MWLRAACRLHLAGCFRQISSQPGDRSRTRSCVTCGANLNHIDTFRWYIGPNLATHFWLPVTDFLGALCRNAATIADSGRLEQDPQSIGRPFGVGMFAHAAICSPAVCLSQHSEESAIVSADLASFPPLEKQEVGARKWATEVRSLCLLTWLGCRL